MKILIINYRYFISGGPETYLFNLKNVLEGQGHKVIPFSINYDKNVKSEYENYFVKPLSNPQEIYFKDQTWNLKNLYKTIERSIYSKEVALKLTELINDTKPDFAIVLHYLRKLSPSVLTTLKSNNIPFAVRLSDYAMVCPNAHLYRKGKSCELCVNGNLFNSVINKCLHNSYSVSLFNYFVTKYHISAKVFENIDTFLCPSKFLLNKMLEAGWAKEKLIYFPTFIELPRLKGKTEKKNQLVFVGRLVENKGLELVFEALKILENKNINLDFQVIIAGTGDKHYVEKLKFLTHKLNLKRINFVGFLNKEQITRLLEESLVSICPSLWYENLPNSVLESFACKTAVIAPNFGSLPEVVINGYNGYLYEQYNSSDLANTILRVFLNREETIQLGINGYDYLKKNYSSESHYNQLIEIIEEKKIKNKSKSTINYSKRVNRVLLVNTYHYNRGGDSKYTFLLSDLLECNKIKTAFFSMKHPMNYPSEYEEYFVDYIDFRELNKKKTPKAVLKIIKRFPYALQSRKKIAVLLDEFKPDIIHLQNFLGHITVSILPEIKKRNIPIVWTLHDFKLLCPNTHFLSNGKICEACKGDKYYYCTFRKCKKNSLPASFLASFEAYFHKVFRLNSYIDKFIAPSNFLRDKFIEYGFDKNEIIHIRNFLTDDYFVSNNSNKTDDYIIFFGQVEEWKGVRTLINAMKNLPYIKLKIVGDGQIKIELESEVKTLGLKNIEFCGYKIGEELENLVSRSLFVVFPSEWYENCPYSIMEAMAKGKAVLASNIGGIPELVKDGVTGQLFEMGNTNDLAQKIEYLYKNRDILIEYGKNSMNEARKSFNKEVHYEKIYEVYKEVLNNAK